jgi:hypothetical protein
MMMDPAYLSALAASFQVHGAALEPGLSDSELDQIEQAAGFVFPPDLRQLLQFVLPTGTRVGQFPEWRTDPVRVLERARGYLADGVAFDVENGVVWPTTWGPRPPGVAQAVARARELVAAARHSSPSAPTVSCRPSRLDLETRYFRWSRPTSSAMVWTSRITCGLSLVRRHSPGRLPHHVRSGFGMTCCRPSVLPVCYWTLGRWRSRVSSRKSETWLRPRMSRAGAGIKRRSAS